MTLQCWYILHLVFLQKLRIQRLIQRLILNPVLKDLKGFALSSVASHDEYTLPVVYLTWFCSVFIPFSFGTWLFQTKGDIGKYT